MWMVHFVPFYIEFDTQLHSLNAFTAVHRQTLAHRNRCTNGTNLKRQRVAVENAANTVQSHKNQCHRRATTTKRTPAMRRA